MTHHIQLKHSQTTINFIKLNIQLYWLMCVCRIALESCVFLSRMREIPKRCEGIQRNLMAAILVVTAILSFCPLGDAGVHYKPVG